MSDARLVLVEGDAGGALQLTVTAAVDDRLVGISLEGAKASPFGLYRGFEMPRAASPSPGGGPAPTPTGPVDAVELDAGKAVHFGWDGFAAVLNGRDLSDGKTRMVDITLKFEEHSPMRLSVPVAAT